MTLTVTNENELSTALVKMFQTEYDKVIATKISDKFMEYCRDNGLDWDLIVDEFQIEDMDDSLIIDAMDDILNTLIEDNHIHINKEIENQQKMHKLIQNINPTHSEMNEITNNDDTNDKFTEYKDKIYKLFENKYNKKDYAKQAVEALNEFVIEEEFDFDGLTQDIESNDSLCISALCDNLHWAESNNIFEILQNGLKNNISLPFNYKNIILNIEEKTKENIRLKFRNLCPNIFVNEHNNKIGDLTIIKCIDIQNGSHGLLLLLFDTWTRYKINNNKLTIDVSTFWDKEYKYNKYLQKNYKIAQINHLKYGLQAFNKRIINCTNNNNIIYDSLSQFVNYTIATSQFINAIISQQNTLPLLFDFWIIPQCIKKKKYIPIIDYDYDDDDDEADDIKHENINDNDEKDGYSYLGYGGIDNNKAPINSIGNIEIYLNKNGYIKNKDFMMTIIEHSADISTMKRRFLDLYKMMNKTSERYKRFIFIVDRRNPKYYLHKSLCDNDDLLPDENSKMDMEKTWNDIVYCIKDRSIINKSYIQYPEVFFELSRNFILPTVSKNDKIGIIDGFNGYMFNLSYHLQSDDVCKSYFTRNGVISRFFKHDTKNSWSQYFCMKDGKNQQFDESLLTLYKDLKDPLFKSFYNETTSI